MKTSKSTILLIDDDKALIDMYTFKFRRDGTFRFLSATNPQEGIDIAKKEKPYLILLDLIMPKQLGMPESLNKETGFWLLERLKSDPMTRNIRTIVFTNLDEDVSDNSSRAKFLGAEDYWLKAHLKPSEVLEKVKVLLNQGK